MKKKIINGILMVALMFAATTSFVSCKDNVDDELLPVYAQLSNMKSGLETRINDIQTQINELKGLETKIEAQEVKIQNLQNELDLLQSQLDTINNEIATLSEDVETIKGQLADIEDEIDALDEAVLALQLQILGLQDQIDKMITDIQINHTINNVTGSWNLPGGMSRMLSLAAFFGSNDTGMTQFPNTDEDAVVIGEALTADEVAAANGQYFHFDADNFLTQNHDNAGLIFFTVNSEDPTQFDINDWTLSVQNSAGRTAPITFSDAKPSSYQIQWGIYKSDYVDTDPDLNGDPTFFQAKAHIDWKDLEAAKFDIEKFIDLQDITKDVKEVIQNVKDAEGKKAKVEALVNTIAKLLVNIYSGNMSGNNYDLKNPSWSAQKLVLSQEIDGVTIKKGAADYDLAVSSVAPLSYNSFWKMEEAFAEMVDTDALENVIAKFANIIKDALPQVGGTTFPVIEELSADGMTAYVWASDNNGAAVGDGAWVALPQEIIDAINNGLKVSELNDALQEISTTTDLGATVDKLADRFAGYVVNFGNKIVSALQNHALTRAVAPIVLYNSADGIKRLISGKNVSTGIMQINVTSLTEELLVPALAKYVALFKDGKTVQAHVYPGSFQLMDLDLSKAGEYELIVSTVDYYGYVCNKKFIINVE
jgi:TolA-binding protein